MTLEALLAELYSAADARRIAAQAGLDVSRLDMDGSALAVWTAVVSEAVKRVQQARLVATVAAEYPERTDELWRSMPWRVRSPTEESIERTRFRQDMTSWQAGMMDDQTSRMRGVESKLDQIKDSISALMTQVTINQTEIERLRADVVEMKREIKNGNGRKKDAPLFTPTTTAMSGLILLAVFVMLVFLTARAL